MKLDRHQVDNTGQKTTTKERNKRGRRKRPKSENCGKELRSGTCLLLPGGILELRTSWRTVVLLYVPVASEFHLRDRTSGAVSCRPGLGEAHQRSSVID